MEYEITGGYDDNITIHHHAAKGYIFIFIDNPGNDIRSAGTSIIAENNADTKSNNVFELKAGTLYPLLHSLESKGYVMSYEDASSGKKRRYYQLTEAGRHHSSEKKQEWMAYQSAVTNVLSMEGGC